MCASTKFRKVAWNHEGNGIELVFPCILTPSSPLEKGDHEVWVGDPFLSQKLGLHPQNLLFPLATKVKRLWGRFTIYTVSLVS